MSIDRHFPRSRMGGIASKRQFVTWVRGAAPYLHAFRGKTFVIAFGGEVCHGPLAQSLAHDCNLLAALGIRLVLVHGARPQIEAALAQRGLTSRYHRGMRITDKETLASVKAATAVTRLELEALLSQGLPNTPMAGSHMRVTSGNFIIARPIGVLDGIDFHYTGAVRRVIADEIRADLDQHNVVLISPLGVSPSGDLFNLVVEDVAEKVAIALKAEKLVYLCDCGGVSDAQGNILSSLTPDEAERLLQHERERMSADLKFFLPCMIRAVRQGVARSHVLGHELEGGLLLEFFTHAGVGTMMTRDPVFGLRAAVLDDISALIALVRPLEQDGSLVPRDRELLERDIERFIVAEHDGMLVGCAALHPFENQTVELACLAVAPEYRHAGLGDQMLQKLEKMAKNEGFSRIFVQTTRSAHWFLERGFAAAELDSLPAEKRYNYNHQRGSKIYDKTIALS